MDLNTEGRNILLFELSSQMTLNESSLQYYQQSLGRDVRHLPRRRALQRGEDYLESRLRTFPVPPSPTSTSLKVGMLVAASAILVVVVLLGCEVEVNRSGRISGGCDSEVSLDR